MTYAGEHFDGVELSIPSPGSPPAMTSSTITSRASSVRSFNSDEADDGIAANVANFEEIGLDDDSIDASHFRETQAKSPPNPYSASFASDIRAASAKHVGPKIHPQAREIARARPQRPIPLPGSRPGPPTLTAQFKDTSTRSLSTGIGAEPQSNRLPIHGLSVRSASSSNAGRRRRSPSPNVSARSLSPRDAVGLAPRPQRRSWQWSREVKSAIDLEKECDDDDDDDIPDGLILDNVPLSPRPPMERSASRPGSASASPERRPKERVRSVGNGTPPVAVDQGSLKSPTWKMDSSPLSPSSTADSLQSALPSPIKGRAKSWTAAILELSPEAKALTEKLEEHADELEKHGLYYSTYGRPAPKPRVKSALAELPPLRRTNVMIDPLPVSKEKEAVLSRTRPSWLPPKDPAEEKRHLREYQRMIAKSIEADKKREASRREKERNKDIAAKAIVQIWEDEILKRWDVAVNEQRTRELWWKGVAPRSRAAVWSRAIGNGLGLTEASFQAALTRSREVEGRCVAGKPNAEDERKMAWFAQIKADAERTWADLRIFQVGAPLHGSLIDVLRAYTMYRSDIGYVSGCNTIAAILLLNLATPAAAFIALANILNRSLPLSFYVADPGAKASVYALVLETLAVKSPRLHQHLNNPELGLHPDEYLRDIFTSCFTQHLSLDECTRLWDVYVFEGDAVFIRAGVALLLDTEMKLLGANTIKEVRDVLSGRSKADEQEKVDSWMARVRSSRKSLNSLSSTGAA
ncbi:TBC domain-containing protein [Durotheca rogersii]|uniref:TBC domain-containing protein n=1 Tax=Durotheca rogersii TaxID=419775 RepID=UPI00221F441C|nr:TBC domain-containing protein [Durotheca rogersii]KAI5859590.1 TBC domain-containing protein [Durotheca rogersii]